MDRLKNIGTWVAMALALATVIALFGYLGMRWWDARPEPTTTTIFEIPESLDPTTTTSISTSTSTTLAITTTTIPYQSDWVDGEPAWVAQMAHEEKVYWAGVACESMLSLIAEGYIADDASVQFAVILTFGMEDHPDATLEAIQKGLWEWGWFVQGAECGAGPIVTQQLHGTGQWLMLNGPDWVAENMFLEDATGGSGPTVSD